MKFVIHYDGKYQDSLVIRGDTIDEVKEKALCESRRRGWDDKDCWSEKVED